MIVIREMMPDDLNEVIEIENALFSVPWSLVGFFSFLMREDALFLVALEDEQVVGYCGALLVLNEGDITNVAVARDRQDRGIGRQLMQAMLQKTKEQGVDCLHLEVRKSNQKAISLYESLGFERVGLRKNYYEEPVEDGIVMSRR